MSFTADQEALRALGRRLAIGNSMKFRKVVQRVWSCLPGVMLIHKNPHHPYDDFWERVRIYLLHGLLPKLILRTRSTVESTLRAK